MANINEMDARLISQGSQVTSVNGDTLVSVAAAEGQPQKNITLSNFADSMANAVPQQTSDQIAITGLYAKTTDGKMVELTKESVASVMKQILNPLCHREWTDGIDADTLMTGTVYCGNDCKNVPDNYCMILTMGSTERAQIAVARATNAVYTRVVIPGTWTRIDNFGCNTPEELSSVIAGLMSSGGLFPFMGRGSISSNTNANDITTPGYYQLSWGSDQGNTNFPKNDTMYGGMIVYKQGSFVHQLIVEGPNVHSRLCYDNGWGGWRRLDNFGYNSLGELSSGVAQQIGLVVFSKAVNAGESVTFNKGYGLLIIDNISAGRSAIYGISNGNFDLLTSKDETGFAISYVSEHAISLTNGNNLLTTLQVRIL